MAVAPWGVVARARDRIVDIKTEPATLGSHPSTTQHHQFDSSNDMVIQRSIVMKSFLGFAALAGSVLAQSKDDSPPFRLFLKSDNATLDGTGTYRLASNQAVMALKTRYSTGSLPSRRSHRRSLHHQHQTDRSTNSVHHVLPRHRPMVGFPRRTHPRHPNVRPDHLFQPKRPVCHALVLRPLLQCGHTPLLP